MNSKGGYIINIVIRELGKKLNEYREKYTHSINIENKTLIGDEQKRFKCRCLDTYRVSVVIRQ